MARDDTARLATPGLGQLMADGDLPSRQQAPRPQAARASRVSRLTIVVPAKNEEQGLDDLLAELRTVLGSFDGLSYEKVAEALGLSVPATKSLLHRARLSLRERLDEYRLAS